MVKKTAIALAATLGLLAMSTTAIACEFSFNYSEIAAPLSRVGEIGVRVQKDHKNCTLPSMDEYQFDWENIQILGETAWEEVDSGLYEKWFQVSLSQIGNGYLKISKDCTKEGYEEAILPISVLEPTEDGSWQQAYDGTYPFADPEAGAAESAVGDGAITEGTLTIAQLALELPDSVGDLKGDIGWARVFYTRTSNDEIVPLLVVTDGLFLRFEHLVGDES